MSEPVGWKLVPIEPSEAMLDAFSGTPFSGLSKGKQRAEREAYAAMLAAAPSRPTNGVGRNYVPQDRLERIVRESADEIAGGQPVRDVLRGAIVLALSASASPAGAEALPAGVDGAVLSRNDVCQLWQRVARERPNITVEGFTGLLLDEIDDRLASAPAQAPSGVRIVDWLAVAKAAGRHCVRYRTNRALEAFLSDIRAAIARDASQRCAATDAEIDELFGKIYAHCVNKYDPEAGKCVLRAALYAHPAPAMPKGDRDDG